MDAVLADLETSPLAEKERVLFRYLRRLNREPWTVRQEHVDVVRAAGWSEQAIFDALSVCALFNFFNRWIDGSGVEDTPPGLYDRRLDATGDMGYAM